MFMFFFYLKFRKQYNRILYRNIDKCTILLFVKIIIEYIKLKEYFKTENVNYFPHYYLLQFDFYSNFQMKIHYSNLIILELDLLMLYLHHPKKKRKIKIYFY